MARFAEKVFLITGAGQGIGRRVAERAAQEGATVMIVDRSPTGAEVAAELSADGYGARYVNADLESWEGAKVAVETTVAACGRIDVLVNNIGGTIWAKPFINYEPHQIEAEVRRSLFPTLWGCRAAIEPMVAAGRGVIVNVSSTATRGLNRVPYAAAKGGVNAITACLAWELADRGIRVVGTAPGGTEAPPRKVPRNTDPQREQDRAWYQVIVDQTLSSSFLKRYGTLDEQAAVILFLASDEASYLTGVTIPVAGGDLG